MNERIASVRGPWPMLVRRLAVVRDNARMTVARYFVSYRRGDTAGRAGRLVDALVDRFGREAVFHDVGSIAPGERFMDRVGAAIATADVVFAVIGSDWMATGPDGRRIDAPDDPVRLELEVALAGGGRIVPVLVDHATMPLAGNLPESLADLAAINAFEIRDESWTADVDRMMVSLGVSPRHGAIGRRRLIGTLAGSGLLAAVGVGGWLALRGAGDRAGDAAPPDSDDVDNYGDLPDWPAEPLPTVTHLRSETSNRTLELDLVNWWIERDSARVVVAARVTALSPGGVSLDSSILTLLVDNVPIVSSEWVWWQGRLGLGQNDTVAVAVDFRDVPATGEFDLALTPDRVNRLRLQE